MPTSSVPSAAPSRARIVEIERTPLGERAVIAFASIALDREVRLTLHRPAPPCERPSVLFLPDATLDPLDAALDALIEAAQRVGLNLAILDPRSSADAKPKARDFWIDALAPPWDRAHRLYSFLTDEAPRALETIEGVRAGAFGAMGHGAGGHGALTAALRNPFRIESASCFAPMAAPLDDRQLRAVFERLLGDRPRALAAYDPIRLVAGSSRKRPIRIDFGQLDQPFEPPWGARRLVEAFEAAGAPLRCLAHHGHDQGPDLVARFALDHLDHHAKELAA